MADNKKMTDSRWDSLSDKIANILMQSKDYRNNCWVPRQIGLIKTEIRSPTNHKNGR